MQRASTKRSVCGVNSKAGGIGGCWWLNNLTVLSEPIGSGCPQTPAMTVLMWVSLSVAPMVYKQPDANKHCLFSFLKAAENTWN